MSSTAASTTAARSSLLSIPREPPKVVVKADLLPALSVLSTVGLIGIPVGWLWARLAPPQRAIVFEDGKPAPLDIETWHSFDALVVFMLLSLVAGAFVGSLVWLLRERRGPVVMIAAVLGSVLAAWLATLMGASFAAGRYEITGAPKVGDVIELAPELRSSWVLLIQPLAVAVAYGVLAAWNGRDDLGRRLG